MDTVDQLAKSLTTFRGAVVVVFPPCDTATLQALP